MPLLEWKHTRKLKRILSHKLDIHSKVTYVFALDLVDICVATRPQNCFKSKNISIAQLKIATFFNNC